MSAQQQSLNTQAKTETPAAAPLAVVASSPLEELKPFLDENGEMDIANLQIGERLERFRTFLDQSKCNLPLWATNLLTQFPAGTKLLLLPYYPTKQDAWRGDAAKAIKLKEGHVEPSADFIINLGNLLGVTLRKVYEGPVELDGAKMYSVRYNAYLTLPNGAVLFVEEEGKDQALYNSNGIQAHIVESTRKKAKRNAIKSLLNIPTSMPEADFDRPWVLLRPRWEEGKSEEANRIIGEQQALVDQSKRLLYSGVPASETVIDVPAEPVAGAPAMTVDQIKLRIRQANNVPELDELTKQIVDMRLTGAEHAELRKEYAGQKKLIEEAAKKDAGGF